MQLASSTAGTTILSKLNFRLPISGSRNSICSLRKLIDKTQPAFSHAALKSAACKIAEMLFIPRSTASFVITPLVPGLPSLDVKPHSPGETRQSERKKSEFKEGRNVVTAI